MTKIDPLDLETLARQLGRPARGVLRVETRCPAGHPQVIKVYPLLRHAKRVTPFPTLFWLTCPQLSARLARLEHVGLIQRLEAALAADAALAAALAEDHRRYASERWQSLSLDDRQWVEDRGWAAALRDRGIGGIADRRHLKCLHLHYAHHLARGNAIGRWLEARFPLPPCAARSG